MTSPFKCLSSIQPEDHHMYQHNSQSVSIPINYTPVLSLAHIVNILLGIDSAHHRSKRAMQSWINHNGLLCGIVPAFTRDPGRFYPFSAQSTIVG